MRYNNSSTPETLLHFYQDHALATLIPFWERAVDTCNGGIFTCFDNLGVNLLSRNKYTWSQGRFVWLWSRLSWVISKGMLPGDPAKTLVEAQRAVQFLLDHVFLENGNCAYLLSETGEKLETTKGAGFDTSVYADCFVVLGLAEYSRVAEDLHVLQRALRLYDRIIDRLAQGDLRSEPCPIPQGFKAHSVCMILLRLTQVLAAALSSLQHERNEEMVQASAAGASKILQTFRQKDGGIAEFLFSNGQSGNALLTRHLNPGHVFESMWFVMEAARVHRQSHWIEQAAQALKKAATLGWDTVHGGLFHFVDCDGGKPHGTAGKEPYERMILDTWDTKLWWPHSEALYATLLAFELTADEEFHLLYRKIHDYVFQTFPNPDRRIGEWIQIRDREGRPLDKCVALPVKDPYHILQNVLLIIELLYACRNHHSHLKVDTAKIDITPRWPVPLADF
ncbi:MAG: AGE family epimerase/isomerase [Acidobacteria bacterium]|nr:AGE family epimerase/isomerase [Acidobacteriota bacterium]